MKFWKSFKSGGGSLANTFGTIDRKKVQQQQQQQQQQQHGTKAAPTSTASNGNNNNSSSSSSQQNNNIKKLSSYTPLSIRRRRSNTCRLECLVDMKKFKVVPLANGIGYCGITTQNFDCEANILQLQ